MFDIGFQELVIIFVVALLVFGPERLPEVGKTLARWVVELRRGIQNAKLQMDTEFEELEKRKFNGQEQPKQETAEAEEKPDEAKNKEGEGKG